MQDTPSAPSTPQAPSLSSQINDYISTLPNILNAQSQYGPQMQGNDLAIQQQYAPQYKALQDSLYPELTALRNQMTSQATTGAQNGGLTPAIQKQYQDQFRANIGNQNGSGIGADYVSRNLINQSQQYQQYNQNLGLSLLGQQPLYNQANSSSANTVGQGYNPGQALSYGQNTYSSYASSYANMYGTNGQLAGVNNQLTQKYIGAGLNLAGSLIPKPGVPGVG